jgi:formylglycine-generating enzyme required for sulfatase activity
VTSRRLLLLASLLVALPARAVDSEWVYVGNPGNPPDPGSFEGSVPYSYSISKYEVTCTQYAEFLNAKAQSDPLGLYDTSMDSDATFGGVSRGGAPGSYTYSVKASFANKPVTYVSIYDAMRFANWLHNGEGSGDTETGAYTLLGGTATPSNGTTISRNADAVVAVPAVSEWYKAAYYSPGGSYFDYPTSTDTLTECVDPASDTGNAANCDGAVDGLTDVGAYGLSVSPYGTLDQGGNVWEWIESFRVKPGQGQGWVRRGGGWNDSYGGLHASSSTYGGGEDGHSFTGFRVVVVPEPAQVLLVLTGGLVLTAARRQHRAVDSPFKVR